MKGWLLKNEIRFNKQKRRGGSRLQCLMKTYKKLTPLLAFLLLFASGCNSCLGIESAPEKEGSRIPMNCLQDMPKPEVQKLDLLFVIDDSDSMLEEQIEVQRQLYTFMDELRKGGGIDQSMHVGVISTSVYVFPQTPSPNARHCGIRPADGENHCPEGGVLLPLVDLQNIQQQNSRVLRSDREGFMEDFRRRINRGVGGSPQETPFEAVRIALLSDEVGRKPLSEGGNKGFLREGARLLIVVLTDEDDCSEMGPTPPKLRVSRGDTDECHTRKDELTPVEDYFHLFKNVLGADREVIWAAIAPVSMHNKEVAAIGDQEGALSVIRNVGCPTSWGSGLRHRRMAELFDPTLQNLHSICLDSYYEPLIDIARMTNVPQYIDLKNIPDKNLAQIRLTRADGSQQICTLHNDGIALWSEGTDGRPDRIYLSKECPRYPSDQKVEVTLFCVS